MRASDGPVLGRRREVVGVERVAELGEARDDARVALVAVHAELRELGLERFVRRLTEEIAEHVHGDALVLEIDLHAGHDADAEALAGGERLGQAVHGVVVGDGDGRETQSRRFFDELRGVSEPSEKVVCVCRSIMRLDYRTSSGRSPAGGHRIHSARRG